MPLIPQNIIRKAKQPDANGKTILDLCDVIKRTEYAPLPALEAILPHLGEQKLPKDTVKDMPFVAAVDRGICAMVTLEAWLRWGHPDDDPAATPTLLDAYQAILSWFKFLFANTPSIVGALASWDHETANCVSSSRSTIITLLEIWTFHSSDVRRAFNAASLGPILNAVEQCLALVSGQVIFLDVMQSSHSVKSFCMALEQRITQVGSLARDLGRLETFTTLLAVQGILTVSLQATGISLQIRSTMWSRGYIRKISALVVELHPQIKAFSAFDIWANLVVLAFQHGTAGVGQLLNTGFLPLFVQDMARTKDDSGPNQRKCLYALRELVAIARTPRGLQALHHRIQAVPSNVRFLDQQAFGDFWNGFVKSTSHSFEHYKLLEKQGQGKLSTKLCDSNMQEDWKKRHHKECRSMSRHHLELKRLGVNYSNRARYFNIETSRMSVSKSLPHFTSGVYDYRVEDKRQAIIAHDIMGIPGAVNAGGTTYPESLNKHFEGRHAGDCAPLEERYAAMIQEYASHEASPKTWLVDVIVPWGRDSILSQLVELLPMGELDEADHPVCSIVRHAWRIEPIKGQLELSS
ncbi:hypothetical protein BKA70DRAFT_1432853 [Coprinopsis sp. MPI-PUGE-AT-0042]|nr:hypothetical protein BKA70DRAFT_1432853 [Coprinopsis sp. MPI-PUGE-AT-0042]